MKNIIIILSLTCLFSVIFTRDAQSRFSINKESGAAVFHLIEGGQSVAFSGYERTNARADCEGIYIVPLTVRTPGSRGRELKITEIGGNRLRRQLHNTPSGDIVFEKNSVFRWCFRYVELSDNITSIGDYAFYLSRLRSITIPKNVRHIGRGAFAASSYLTQILLDENNPFFISYSGALFNKEKTILIAFPAGKDVDEFIIPEGVEIIADYAFSGSRLSSVIIPKSVRFIGSYAFWLSNVSSVIIPEGIITIGNSTFRESSLSSIVIPESVRTIGDYAFQGCRNLTQINLPDSIMYIGRGAFKESGLSSFIIPEGIKAIGNSTFRGSSLSSIIIPESVRTIGDYAFRECRNLTQINLPDSIIDIGQGAFRHSGLSSFTIPLTIDTIRNRVFFGVRGLSHIAIPYNIKHIGHGAFSFSGLDSVSFPYGMNSNITVCRDSFRDTPLMRGGEGGSRYIGTILLGYRPSGIENNRFVTEKAVIKEGTTHIAGNAFFIPPTYVFIPSSVTCIGHWAIPSHFLRRLYVNWTNLDSVRIAEDAFIRFSTSRDIPTVRRGTLIVPRGTRAMYQQAEPWKHFRIRERRR